MRYAFKFPVEKMCNVFEISRSGYYKWHSKLKNKRHKQRALDREIRSVFIESRQDYGSPRIALCLAQKGINCSKSTVGRRMKAQGLVARKKKKFKKTTQSNHSYRIAPNILQRNFNVERPGQAWVSDITYIWVNNQWMYLTTVIDLADRMVIGWSLSSNMKAETTVIPAFSKACSNRTPGLDLIFHSDRGVQYACDEFRDLLCHYKVKQSMSRKGNCWDNAVAESFFKTLKVELVYKHVFQNKQHAYSILFDYIDGWYNTIRIHTALDGISPQQAFNQKINYLNAA